MAATVIRAYRFTFEHVGTVFRLCWMPLVILCLPWPPGEAVGLRWWLAEPRLLILAIVVGAVKAVCLAMVLNTVLRMVLFDVERPATIIPPTLQRTDLSIAIVILVAQVFSVLARNVLLPASQLRIAQDFGDTLLVTVPPLFVYLSVRFFPLCAMAAVTGRVEIGRTWFLAAGNWWRLLWLIVACGVPSIAFSAIGSVLAGDGATSPAMRAVLDVTVSILATLVLTTLWGAGMAYAYKALAGYRPDETVRAPIMRP